MLQKNYEVFKISQHKIKSISDIEHKSFIGF